ncbi:MAG: hypothetical protein JRG91_02800 [Deltaproteobacteria bacterium]|nr:hypothetical protein [Deltaproteobacteria bacterium]
MNRRAPILLALAATMLAASPTGPVQVVERQVLLAIEPGEKVVDLVVSPDLDHWLAVTTFDDRGVGTGGGADDKLGPRRVHVSGATLGAFGHIPSRSVTFHPVDGRTAFVTVTWGKKGFGKYQIVVDGQALGDPGHYSEQVEVNGGPGPWFSPDGGRLVWLGNWKSGQYVVTDGKIKKGSGHDALLMESPWTAGGALVVIARDDGVESLLVDGQAVATADGIRLVTPRPPGRGDVEALAWVERGPDGERFVLEGVAGPGFDRVGEVACSRGGLEWAYAARDQQGAWYVVRGAERQGPWKAVASPAFSPDGGLLAYEAMTAEGWRLVVDGTAGAAWKAIEEFVFLGEGRMAMVARDGARRVLLRATAGSGEWTEAGRFQRVFKLVPGPHGALAASVLEAGRSRLFARDRLLGPAGDELRACTIAFSASGAHVAAALREHGKDVMTLDGAPVGSWDAIACPVIFEGEVLTFIAWNGPQLESVSVEPDGAGPG